MNDVVTYTCNDGYVWSTGVSLKSYRRTCTPKGVLDGESLVCVKDCPNGWKYLAGADLCAKHAAGPVYYEDAVSACINKGARITMPKTSLINDRLKEMISGYTWIGLTDTENEGTFVWADKSSVDFTNWGTSEPGGNSNENCVTIASGRIAGQWQDRPCRRWNNRYDYVCEVPYDTAAGTCNVVDPVNGKSNATDGAADLDEEVLFSCNEGFVWASGETRRTCLVNGSLTGEPLVCVKVIQDQNCYTSGMSEYYHGTVNTTSSGHICQAWSAQTPYKHGVGNSATDFQNDGGEFPDNYCRDPKDGKEGYIWCYTITSTRWEKCDVPACPALQKCDVETPAHGSTSASDGIVAIAGVVTYTCDEGYMPSAGDLQRTCLANGELTGVLPVCIQVIQDVNCYTVGMSDYYHGDQTTTKSGRTCQDWSAQTPYTHTIGDEPSEFPGDGGQMPGNKCRDPSKDENFLWCYTTDANKRWEKCSVPACPTLYHCGVQTPDHGSSNATDSGKVAIGETVTFACDDGYYISAGQPDQTCKANGKFNGDAVVCTKINNCDVAAAPAHGTSSVATPTVVMNDVVTYTCDEGYVFSTGVSLKTYTRTCLSTGEMSGESYTCVKDCPSGWKYLAGTDLCAKQTTTQSYYEEAVTACTGQGATIATLKTELINQRLREMATGTIWIGLNDIEAEGTFVWNDKSAVDYTNWGTNQPNTRKTGSANKEDCVAMDDAGKWQDNLCKNRNKRFGFVCVAPYATAVSTCTVTDPANGNSSAVDGSVALDTEVSYSCEGPYVKSSGDMKRTCLVDGSLGGQELVCVKVVQDVNCYTVGLAHLYRGSVSTTKSGFTCQRWTANKPWSHGCCKLAAKFPSDGGETVPGNMCRDPTDGTEHYPWCYTTDKNKRWEACDVPKCPVLHYCDVEEPSNGSSSANGGTVAIGGVVTYSCNTGFIAASGQLQRTCQLNGQMTGELPVCAAAVENVNCYKAGQSQLYTGTVSTTQSGRKCQAWRKQKPNSHSAGDQAADFPQDGNKFPSNYCRDPADDIEGYTWCYTVTGGRWERCSVPECP